MYKNEVLKYNIVTKLLFYEKMSLKMELLRCIIQTGSELKGKNKYKLFERVFKIYGGCQWRMSC